MLLLVWIKLLLQEFTSDSDGGFSTDYDIIKEICDSMTFAVKFMKHYLSLSIVECAELCCEGLKSLEFHKNVTFIKAFVEVSASRLPMECPSEEIIRKFERKIIPFFTQHKTVRR